MKSVRHVSSEHDAQNEARIAPPAVETSLKMACYPMAQAVITDSTNLTQALFSSGTSIQDVLLDDTHQQLANCFLASGRGRPPNPPTGLRLTNKVLLQLRQLQRQSGKPSSVVHSWFEKLFPEVTFPADRIGGVIDRTEKQFKEHLSGETETTAFLLVVRDLDFVSDALSHLGLRRGELLGECKLHGETTVEVTNQVVVDIELFRSNEKLGKQFTVKWLQCLTNHSKTGISEYLVKKTFEKYRSLNKKQKSDPEQLKAFLNQSFLAVCDGSSSKDSASGSTNQEACDKNVKKLSSDNNTLREQLSELGQKVITMEEIISELAKEKNDMLGQLHNRSPKDLSLKLDALKGKYEQKRRELYETERRLKAAKEQVTAAKQELTQLKKEHDATVKRLQAQLHEKERQKDILLRENQALQHDDRPIIVKTRIPEENNRFADNVRETVLNLQASANVPSTRCAAAMKIVAANIFGVQIQDKDLPCPQTCVNIAGEGAVLANVQATEAVLNSQNCTLHTDGTSRSQRKYVSQQFTLDDKTTLTLGYRTVVCEDAATLLEVTIKQLEEMSELYAEATLNDQQVVYTSLLEKMTSLMSDRASVMKKFSQDFHDFVRTQLGRDTVLHFLHCNAHFLLGLSRACEIGMKTVESEGGKKLGRDVYAKYHMFARSAECATSRVIRTSSALVGPRGDQKSGCREEWLAFCDGADMKSRMTSYRSNRFNSYFEGAASVIYHRQALLQFFPSLPHSNLLIQSVQDDLADNTLMALTAAIAVLYLRVTGPYWQILESGVKYTEFHLFVKDLTKAFDRWEDDASELLDRNFEGIFQGDFELEGDKTAMWDSVFDFVEDPTIATLVLPALQKLMPGLLGVSLNQLIDFLQGGKFGGPPAVFPEGLDHCPLTNLLGENVFGDFDFDIQKHRNSTLQNRSARQMLAHNKTPEWLSKKEEGEKIHLLHFARKKAPGLMQQRRRQEKLVFLKLRERMAQQEATRQMKAAKLAQQKAELIQRIAEQGGACTVRADVSLLLRRLRRRGEKGTVLLEAVKDQIRYQKCVLGQKGQLKLSGTVEELGQILEEHLGDELEDHVILRARDDENEPPAKQARLEDDVLMEPEPFTFTRQGEWLAVFYDHDYYIGQVISIDSPDSASIKYLQRSAARPDHFKWPAVEDIAETAAHFVFRWDLDLAPVSSDGRMWRVLGVEDIIQGYSEIKSL